VVDGYLRPFPRLGIDPRFRGVPGAVLVALATGLAVTVFRLRPSSRSGIQVT
jgi:hypothetical protein